MGQTVARITIHGPRGSHQLEGLAGTAATFTKIPAGVAKELGLKAQFEVPVELGDGRSVTRQLTLAEVEIEGVRRPVLVAMAENGEQPLIGYTTLETLGFKVNSVKHALESTPAIEYWARPCFLLGSGVQPQWPLVCPNTGTTRGGKDARMAGVARKAIRF